MKKCIAFLFALILGVNGYAQRYLGGDISLLPAYKANGTVYQNKDGRAACPYEIFKESGWNAMRVRLFVNPDNAPQANKDEGVCQDLDYVVGLCKQIKNHGFKLMLDFHYSDTCYEAEITGRGTYFHVIAGKHRYGNYICIPNHNVGSELSGFRDLFWNTERLSGLIKKVDAVTVAHGLCHLEELIHPKKSVDN